MQYFFGTNPTPNHHRFASICIANDPPKMCNSQWPNQPPQQIIEAFNCFLGVFLLPNPWTIPKQIDQLQLLFLVGGWTNPSEKFESNWKPSPIFGVNINTIWNHRLVFPWWFFGPPPALPLHHWLSSHVHSASRRPVPHVVPLGIHGIPLGIMPGDSIRALCGMVKTWPFQGVQWPPTRGWKGHFESPGAWIGWFSMVNYK